MLPMKRLLGLEPDTKKPPEAVGKPGVVSGKKIREEAAPECSEDSHKPRSS